ncbi:hypothetical protein [Lichenicola sp.]|uniref:hypothetical protein n=1 Tax=Lichenicola sp. TaxID=2804529 RepID=UPI003B002B83
MTLPELGLRYWVAISLASVFGANLGDFVAHDLHLGHWQGLFPLALLMAAILLLQRRVTGEGCYWAGIIVVRTAATNLADLLTHDMHVAYPWVILGLAVLLCLLVGGQLVRAGRDRLVADGWYWAAMLTAGTLGTAIGDCVADRFGLGPGGGTLVLGPIMVVVLAAGRGSQWSGRLAYWSGIVAVRSAGTTAGDYWVRAPWIDPGLPLATACSGAVFVATVLLWRPRRMATAATV